jgi:hypothetical protein
MRILAAAILLFPWQTPTSSEPLRLPVTADTMLSMSHGEEKLNHGSRSALRLKGIEDLSLFEFDLSPLKGRTVEEARLYVFPVGPHKLRTIGVSTVGSPWKEGAGHNKPAQPGEPCYLEAAAGERPWGHPGSDFHAVSFSRGGSIWFPREIKAEADGWLSIDIPPAVLHAMLEGNSFGLALADESNTGQNNSVYSREQNAHAPYLQVARWKQGAPPASGAKKYVAPPAKKAVDRSGEILRAQPAAEAVAPVAMADGTKVRVLYEGETNPDAAPAARIWNGRAVSLVAARGEHVGFEIALELPQPRAVRLEGAGWTASRVLPVGSTFDPLVPVAGEASGKALFHVERYVPKNSPTGELKAPLSLKVGDAELSLPVSLRVHSAALPDVLSFHVSLNAYHSPGDVAGDKAGTPGFMELERAYHRMAHEHRATMAIVPYSHRGNLQWAVAPEIRRTGAKVEVTSWATFDERYGPYFDGSAFKGLPRDGVPLAHLYWPHHENWPLPINDYYSYKGTAADHWRDAPAPEKAFAEDYGKAFGAMVREFAQHASSKGWSRTQFHVFLNNKPDIRFQRKENEGAWWRLDEPVSLEDHLAIAYFAKRSVDAVKDIKNVSVTFRADLSRPQCRRESLDGILGLDVVAGSYRQYPELVFNKGEEVWIYGGVPIGGSGESARAWTIQCYLDGADGLLPWLALGSPKAWKEPEDTAILLPPQKGMEKRPYATLRLKGLRRGQQDVELIRLAALKLKASRDEVRAGIARSLGLIGSFVKTSEVDAGQIDYGKLDPDKFEVLRRSLLETLDK